MEYILHCFIILGTSTMNSYSSKFDSLLAKLKISEDVKPDGQTDKGWMWKDPDCAILLDYLIENISESNVINPAERLQYEQLSQQGHVVSGRNLTDALQAASGLESLSKDSLEAKISSLSKLSDSLNVKKARLKQMSSDLKRKTYNSEIQIDKMKQLSSSAHQELREQLLNCENEHLKFQQLLKELREVIHRLHFMYTGSDMTFSKLLCQTDLDNVHEGEQSYTAALAEFTDKRFFEGVSDMAGDHDESYYRLVDISDPQLLSLHQDCDEHLLESCEEMKRLQQMHSMSLRQNVDARVNHAKCEAACQVLEDSSKEMEQLCRLSTEQLKNHLERVKGKLAIYSRELSSVEDIDLKAAIEQTNLLKETYILSGDYNLKLARQQYFLDCQQQVISKLVDQRARNEILTLMLEIEMEEVQNVRHILASIAAYLQQLVSSGKHRLATLEDAEIMSSKYSRTNIDSKDVLLNTVDKLTDEKGDRERVGKVFTTFKEVVENASKLISLHQERTTTDTLVEHQITHMKKVSEDCLAELMLTADDNNSLLPVEVNRKTSELTVQLKLMESNIRAVMSIISQKKKLLAGR